MQRIVKTDDGIASRDIRSVAALFGIGVDEDVLALFDLDDVVVAGNPPQLMNGIPVHRIVLAKPSIRVPRIDVKLRIEKIDVRRLGGGHGPSPGSFT